uniref:Uncharacterized protein n=1 Tax=Arundo donax TaxID=35708 RepID=A0A0A9C153_ARUDO
MDPCSKCLFFGVFLAYIALYLFSGEVNVEGWV